MFEARRITNGKLSPGNGNETQLSKIDPFVLRNSYEKREEKIRLKGSIEAEQDGGTWKTKVL